MCTSHVRVSLDMFMGVYTPSHVCIVFIYMYSFFSLHICNLHMSILCACVYLYMCVHVCLCAYACVCF